MDNQNQPLWFLATKTPEQLHSLMRATNRRFNKRFHYLNPVFANGKWYVWFEITESDKLREDLSTEDKS